jgi:FAD/FMN-containing dehydrogenase
MAVADADWNGLASAIAGSLILPHSPDYESVRKPAMARFENVRPAAVVLCKTPADVSETIRFAARAGFPTAIRSGGHSVAGHSSTDGVVIDVTPMRSVSVADGVATVGAGVRLGALYDALQPHGLTIPAGCGPFVGIAGLTLGGGIGILGRRYGLTCDHLIQAEVVLADGRIVECDEHHDEELFWALRGAGGGNFGVVTSFVFRTLPAPAATVFQLAWPVAHAAAVAQAWQAWAPTAPDELDATLRLTALDEERRPPSSSWSACCKTANAMPRRFSTSWLHAPARTQRRHRTGTCPSESRRVTSPSSDPSRIGTSRLPRSSRCTRAISSRSRNSFGNRCRPTRFEVWWRTSCEGSLRATHAR